MRIFTVLVLPLMLLGCGRAISGYDPHSPSGLDLSILGLDERQMEQLTQQLARPFYYAAATAMFLFAMLLWVFDVRYLLTVVLCILLYAVLQMGTLAYLYHVVKRNE